METEWMDDFDTIFKKTSWTEDDIWKLEEICWKYLITGNWFNYENLDVFKKHGYLVKITEKDSYGILGVLVTKHGKKFYFG